MVLQRGEAPPPPPPWDDVPEVEYRLYKNPIKMGRSFNSVMVSIKRLIERESAKESQGTQFVTNDDEDLLDTVDGKLHIHKIPQLPLSENKYFIIVMYPPDDLEADDTPMDGNKEVKFLFSFYNLYLTGFSYDDKIWHVFDDAKIVGISQNAREMYVKKLGFCGDYNTIKQNYLKLDIGFRGQCDTYNKIIGRRSNKTSDDQLIRVLCRTTITLPESARFPFLAQLHLRTFHSGNFDAVLDMLVVEGEEHKNFSVHLTKWGTYSTLSKLGKKCFNASKIPTPGIQSFSELLNFIAIATNKKYDEDKILLENEVEKKQSSDDGDADKGNQGHNKDNEVSQDNKKNAEKNDKTCWFYQAPLMPYVQQRRQTINLDGKSDVGMRAMLEIHRKAPLKDLSWTPLSQYFVEAGGIAVRRVRKEDLRHVAKATGAAMGATFADMEGEETFDPSFLAHAAEAIEERISDDEIILVKGTNNTSLVSIILRGANDFMLDETELSLRDAPLDSNMVAAGGRALEAALSVNLENQARTRGCREKLAIAEFAESLLIILKVHDQLMLERPSKSSGMVKATLIECMFQSFFCPSILGANLAVDDSKCVQNWYGQREQEDSHNHDQLQIAVKRVRKEDLRHVAKPSCATTVPTFADMEGEETFDPSFLGHADDVVEERISDDEIVLVKGTNNTSLVSIVLRGANDFMLDETELSLHDAPVDSNMVAASGGSLDAALSVYLENQARTFGSREQLATVEFAESLLIIPKVHNQLTLEGSSESSGMAKTTLVECMSQPLCFPSILGDNLAVDNAKSAHNWYADRAQEDPRQHDHYLLGRVAVVA